MLQQLANLPDNELMARARKLKDEEAAGILLERYCHLLAAVSLPSLNNYGNTPDDFFPPLLQRLFKSLQTQTIPKLGEWMQFFVKSQGNRTARNQYYFPTSASSDITRVEYKTEKANSNLLQKQQLVSSMNTAFDQLKTADREALQEFYLEQKTFAEIAAEQGTTIEEVRLQLKRSKQELASLVLADLEHAKAERQEQDFIPEAIIPEPQVAKLYTEYIPLELEAKVEEIVYPKAVTQKPKKFADTTKPRKQEQGLRTGYTKIVKQEQDSNLGYAKSGKQGQDIKDLQQGSLF
ncbi:RNA polymerase sigma factor [Chitinophaga rhizophila]|uniref:RNA polymerase sigma factor 70 region 4 type 2 domain-containing protein n=1 Tax=Chitinophaga rhizophila TaxID=2866212 RepID=A0ABS7G6Y5_9BACT|nr:sigma factor-like helix-turn-helix DNA-binding protein [Chitinophaga rhizophila]MBW8683161.1 hypothetical protein [Chitinophaga rhizophila]